MDVDNFNVEKIGVYESLLTKGYDFETNLSLLKLYSYFPEHMNIEIVSSILYKSLMVLPNTDFLLCSALIPEKVYNKLSIIFEMADLLERCNFPAFWVMVETNSKNLPKDFSIAIREGFISGVLEISFQKITFKLLSHQLNLKDKQLEEFVKSKGWSTENNNEIAVLPLCDSNQAIGRQKEPITSKQLSPFIKKNSLITDL
eukprot:c53993_g1_i1.p1 GENE.c53993_g1_i1~~c53993_g1_i1.p1  ORF type:complete len:201 (-),score=7.07 c53993_g1_i1:13-615(-)